MVSERCGVDQCYILSVGRIGGAPLCAQHYLALGAALRNNHVDHAIESSEVGRWLRRLGRMDSSAAVAQRRASSSTPARVLVTEDDDATRNFLTMALQDERFHVEAARNGREAIDKLMAFPAEVVVLDLMMPVMDGWKFLHTCETRHEMAVVVTSGCHKLPTDPRVRAVLKKPYDVTALLAAVNHALYAAAPT